MALLRPITQQALNDVKYDVRSRDIHIEESERYSIAKKMFEEDKSILYFFYWSDADEENGNFYTYLIGNDKCFVFVVYLFFFFFFYCIYC